MKENVLYCKEGHEPIAKVSKEEKGECPGCKKGMEVIGYFESEETHDKVK